MRIQLASFALCLCVATSSACNAASDCSSGCCVNSQCAAESQCAGLSGWVVAIIVVAALIFVFCFLGCCFGWFRKCAKSDGHSQNTYYTPLNQNYEQEEPHHHHHHSSSHHHHHHHSDHDGGHHDDGGNDGGDD